MSAAAGRPASVASLATLLQQNKSQGQPQEGGGEAEGAAPSAADRIRAIAQAALAAQADAGAKAAALSPVASSPVPGSPAVGSTSLAGRANSVASTSRRQVGFL